MARKKGNTKHGNKNEIILSKSLNRKRYKNLNTNLKKFIKYIANNEKIELSDDTIISARYEPNNKLKQDFYVCFCDKEFAISLKMGTGNSTHQEKCDDFIIFLKDNCSEVDDSVFDDVRILIWADGTTDGSGQIEDRLSKEQYIENYSEGLKRVQQLLKDNEEALIRRDLLIGKNDSRVDYIYHGTKDNGKWVSSDVVVEFNVKNSLIDNKGKALLALGRMTMQVWNRSLNGKQEKRRGQLQIKYSKMKKDFDKIMSSNVTNVGTYEGDVEEYNISSIMNRNKKHRFWKVMGVENADDLYVVRVTNTAYSNVAKRKVKTKTDAYVIKCNLSDTFLLEREYGITEKDIKGKKYEIVANTGISVKIKNSKDYTYQKFSHQPFRNAFSDYIENIDYIFAALCLYCSEKTVKDNRKIIKELNIDEGEFIDYFKTVLKRRRLGIKNYKSVKKIRSYCEQLLKDVIKKNGDLANLIFAGRGNFASPYFVDYIYKSGDMTPNVIPEKYLISNGSGRHNGTYTIIFKPLK